MQGLPVLSRLVLSPELLGGLLTVKAKDSPPQIFRTMSFIYLFVWCGSPTAVLKSH